VIFCRCTIGVDYLKYILYLCQLNCSRLLGLSWLSGVSTGLLRGDQIDFTLTFDNRFKYSERIYY